MLPPADVSEMNVLRAHDWPLRKIADLFGVPLTRVWEATRKTKRQPACVNEERMREMRSGGATLQCIAEKFGVSASYVRQLLRGMPAPPKQKPFDRAIFARQMKSWLRRAGYHHCSGCQSWAKYAGQSVCIVCNRRRAREWYYKQKASDPEGLRQRIKESNQRAYAKRRQQQNLRVTANNRQACKN